jgi:hypothetical protein
MPTFVIEVDGQDFEIEAPDEKAAVQGAMIAAKQNPREQYSKLGSGAMGAVDAASFGFADELAGAGGFITGNGYEATRDSVRKNMELAQQDNPFSYGAGQVGGGLATALVPGGALLRGAQGATKLGRAMAVGAGQGAAYGVGSGETLEDRVGGGVKGALIGGATAGGANVLGKALTSARRVPIGRAPTDDALMEQAKGALNNTKGVRVPPEAVTTMARKQSQYIAAENANRVLHPNTKQGIEGVQEALETSYRNGEISLGRLHNARKLINLGLKNSKEGSEDARHLMNLKKIYDDVITKSVPEYAEGIKTYERAMSARRIQDMMLGPVDQKTGAQGRLPFTRIKEKFSKLAESKEKLAKFSPDEQALIKKIARGGRASDKYILGTLAKVSGISGRMAAAIGAYSGTGGGVQGAMAGAGASSVVEAINNAIKNKQVDKIGRLVEELAAVRRNAGIRPGAPQMSRATTQIGMSGIPLMMDQEILPEITVRPPQ